MKQTIYLVKKDPESFGSEVEWLQFTGKEFYDFTHSQEGKGRYFIRLTDDVSYECPEIFIEATYEQYRKWQKEYDAHRYLMELEESFTTVSADAPGETGVALIDTLASPDTGVEETVFLLLEKEELIQKVKQLPPKERYIIISRFLLGKPQTEQTIAKALQISQPVLHRKIKKILKKICSKGV